jgi:hypothetical protein
MRRVAIVFCFLFALASAAAGQDQLPDAAQACSNQSSSCSLPNSATSSNILYVFARSEGALTTPTDTRSTSLSLISSATVGGAHAYTWCGTFGSSGSDTITLNGSVSFGGLIAIEFPAGNGIGCTTDGTTQTGQTTSGTVTTTSITPTQQNDLAFCFQTNFHSGSFPQSDHSGGWLDYLVNNGSDSMGLAYKYTGTSLSAFSCTFTGGSDSNGNYILVLFKTSALKVVTSSLPTAISAKSYKYCPQAIGGTGSSYTWTTSSGSLPSGLSWSSGCISGTPTGSTTTPTIQVDDGNGHTATAALTLTVAATENTIAAGGNTASGANLTGTANVGDCVLVSQNLTNPSNISPPTDTLGTVFKRVGTYYGGSSGNSEIIWIGQTTSSGSETMTYSSGSTSQAVRFTNCQVFRDNAAVISGTSTGTITGPSVVTMAPDSEVWGGFMGQNTGSAGTGWSTDSTSGGSMGVHALESTVGTYTPTVASDTSSSWVFWGVHLRPSGSGTVASGTIKFRSRIF